MTVEPADVHRLRIATVATVLALIVLCVAWELVLAPLRPGGSWLALKALPLAVAVPALLRGATRTYQLWSMLMLLYLCEGIVRGMSDGGVSAWLGWVETALAAAAWLAIMGFVRRVRAARQVRAADDRVGSGGSGGSG